MAKSRWFSASTREQLVGAETGGGGGGGSDVTMPTPSAPMLFNRNGTIGIAWDGLDNAGNPMPAGFGKLSIQAPTLVPVPGQPWQTAAVGDWNSQSDASPYDPTPNGWTLDGNTVLTLAGGVMSATGAGLTAGALAGLPSIHVDCGGPIQQVWVPNSADGEYLVMAMDNWATQANGIILALIDAANVGVYEVVNGAIVASNQLIGTPGTPLRVRTDGKVVTLETFTSFIDSPPVFTVEATVTLLVAKTGGLFGVAFAAPCAHEVKAVGYLALQESTYAEVGALSGAGVAFLPNHGHIKFAAVNTAGHAGPLSAVTTITYPAQTFPNLAQLGTVALTGVALGDVLEFDGSHWVNSVRNAIEADMTGIADQDVLWWNAGLSKWEISPLINFGEVLFVAGLPNLVLQSGGGIPLKVISAADPAVMDLELDASAGFAMRRPVLKAPNASLHELKVANDGTLSTIPYVP